ncbi:Uncharacterised protein (plasmid) [Tsukamurella tyrosinosolvens]|uniref:DUF7715 domain-containing protein n=1 Tax=Tsukamurella tyrosinosolvens TaxID=57704 RepID=A0A1H4V988_TSUTY|nr:hypothetical protein [Tsukamurella tyrosinosolvens]KXO91027.1 hypothetical protein AXK58_21595 [Tsukamurella tyrosinosolvens]SEC77081.1 hypothetical protein SAMN04489793_3170 [Tsukamurella tyrosinosolvens]VEH90632.1 Uncharacterised protein [Tsukamurella tyrosinosolvens]
MHILTISDRTFDPRDFTWGQPGELAFPGMVCCNRDSCGCSRAFSGAITHKASTVLEVEDSALTRSEVLTACRDSMQDAGWTFLTDSDIAQIADTALDAAAVFTPGTLVRPRCTGDDEWTFAPV